MLAFDVSNIKTYLGLQRSDNLNPVYVGIWLAFLRVQGCSQDTYFFSWLFGHLEKTAWLEMKINFKSYDLITWLTNNYITHIAQYLQKYRQPENEWNLVS